MSAQRVDRHNHLVCRYFEAGACRSCSLIETPYSVQLAGKEARCRELLPQVPEAAWLAPFTAGDRGFRNRAKLVVGGAPGAVTLGILDRRGLGVDLRECAIQAPGIAEVIPALARFLEGTGLPPYSVPERRGELKYVHVTEAPSDPLANGGGELMLRFVARTQRSLDVLRSRLGELRRAVPRASVISVNLLPEHKAVLEGEREELLLGDSLPMRLGTPERPLTLHLRPQSFFQTNTAVARELYAQAAEWVGRSGAASMWDLYCGVGGFALHCAGGGAEVGGEGAAGGGSAVGGGDAAQLSGADRREVLGVELSAAAIESARRSAREAGLGERARFIAADATEFALGSSAEQLPELVVVNPPRRGIGERLSAWLQSSGVPHLIYSSCNPATLATDLAAMPSYRVREARLFDMFPHTDHLEVAVRLERAS